MSFGIESNARTSISFVPQPAGIIPTPTSTSPMYVSAEARTRSACSTISQPPPKTIWNGATTTGFGEYRKLMTDD